MKPTTAPTQRGSRTPTSPSSRTPRRRRARERVVDRSCGGQGMWLCVCGLGWGRSVSLICWIDILFPCYLVGAFVWSIPCSALGCFGLICSCFDPSTPNILCPLQYTTRTYIDLRVAERGAVLEGHGREPGRRARLGDQQVLDAAAPEHGATVGHLRIFYVRILGSEKKSRLFRRAVAGTCAGRRAGTISERQPADRFDRSNHDRPTRAPSIRIRVDQCLIPLTGWMPKPSHA